MNIEQQFREVLQHAIDNGWDICGFLCSSNCEKWYEGIHQWQNVVDLEIYFTGHKRVIQADTIWFDHDFATAFFKEGPEMKLTKYTPKGISNFTEGRVSWKVFMLQQLAFTPREKRLDFLYEYLEGGDK